MLLVSCLRPPINLLSVFLMDIMDPDLGRLLGLLLVLLPDVLDLELILDLVLLVERLDSER